LSDLFSSNLKSPWICGLTNNQSTKPSFIYWVNEIVTLMHWVKWFQNISWSQNVNWRLLQWLLEYVKNHLWKEHKIFPWLWGVKYIFILLITMTWKEPLTLKQQKTLILWPFFVLYFYYVHMSCIFFSNILEPLVGIRWTFV
jgi:hypothetical protein